MDRFGRLKEEYGGGASSSHFPQPMEGLHDSGPPPFLTKTYDIVEDFSTNHIISWSRGNNSFVVWDPQTFSMSLLPRYFKHNNFSSFVRQLNTYGFRKVDPDKWEFANEGFLRGQKHLLKNIRRRKTQQLQASSSSSSQQSLDPCVELGRFGIAGEVARLRRDKQVLMMELVKLRQQQQTTKSCLQTMENRLQRTETKQQHMMNFLARAMQNPNFIQQLALQKDKRKELEDAISKKRRRSINQGPNNVQIGSYDHTGVLDGFVKIEPEEFGEFSEFRVPEFDAIDMSMQGLISSGGEQNLEEEYTEKLGKGSYKEQLDERFWDDLLNEEEIGVFGDEVDVDMLVQQLGYLGSSLN
ncbi:heat stress transcription factor A-6b-like [Euphorbia lathyris]|uniref:heat stress transcription factor A-6b-like n=1 Tax=Euphorbia lathyris TaxID=212925 RepID=UPI0033138797